MTDSSQPWVVRNKFRLQVIALALVLSGPLLMFALLQAGIGVAAIIIGVIVVGAMGLILWVS